jgi:hypothetical protein
METTFSSESSADFQRTYTAIYLRRQNPRESHFLEICLQRGDRTKKYVRMSDWMLEIQAGDFQTSLLALLLDRKGLFTDTFLDLYSGDDRLYLGTYT